MARSGKFSRFLNLERKRDDVDSPKEGLSPQQGRFDALQISQAKPGEPALAPGHVARFEAPAERGLELQTGQSSDQPFVRCARCEIDNSQYALSCLGCGENLQTSEQRAFNEQYWQKRRGQLAQEKGELVEYAAQRAADEEEQKRLQRQGFEALARQVALETRSRLGIRFSRYGLFRGLAAYTLWAAIVLFLQGKKGLVAVLMVATAVAVFSAVRWWANR